MMNLERLQNLERLENLERLQNLERLERLNEINLNDSITDKIHTSCLDYSQVKIKPNSVIYCDIPYEGTSNYIVNIEGASRVKSSFDYERFYNWACSQKELVVISSYEIKDDRFICVFEKEKLSLFNPHAIKDQGKERLVKVEKLYIPKKQLNLWSNHNEVKKQLNIFDLLGE